MDAMWSDRALLVELGERFQRERLNQNLTQQELADRSGVSRNTVSSLESGGSVSLSTMIKVLRSLKMIDRLDNLMPTATVSPVRLADLQGRERERASRRRSTE